MTEPIVRTEPLGGSPLARAAMAGSASPWYLRRPVTASEWRTRVHAVSRETRGEWLGSLQPAFDASGAAKARLARVVAAGGVVVTTGQQPGLFGGPIYTWSKAISALALADEIERTTGIPAAPVFWAATDDADYAEASWTAVAVTGGALRLALPAAAPVGRPMSEMPLGDPSEAIEALVRACGATVDDRPIAAVRAAYRSEATVGGAYLTLLRTLFEPWGIPVLDASHEAVARSTRPLLVRALERAERVATALRERDEAIRAAGFEPQVAEVAGLSLVFERPVAGGDKRRLNIAEAGAVRAGGAQVLSPNVLLRPVIERSLLPTVAYVAGPGEFAYFAQVSAVAESLELPTPLVVPRWSATIIEPHVARALARFGLAADDLADPHGPEGRLAREAMPAGISTALDALRRDVASRTEAIAHDAAAATIEVDAAVIDGARRGIVHRVDRLERRLVSAIKRREADTMRQIATARGALYPLGTRQERALNMLPLLARHGSVVVERMRQAAGAHARSLMGVEPGTALGSGDAAMAAASASPPNVTLAAPAAPEEGVPQRNA